jgi:hypothetical protein
MQIAKTYSEGIVNLASQTLMQNRVAVFVVACNAIKHIETVLNRVPDLMSKRLTEIFIIDDSSNGATVQEAISAKWTKANAPLRVFRTPYNQGWGGNQRLGYYPTPERAIWQRLHSSFWRVGNCRVRFSKSHARSRVWEIGLKAYGQRSRHSR